MFTILGGDAKEYGPVSSEQIREWIAAGRANLDTRARRIDETEWKRLGDFPEFIGTPTPTLGATPAPAAVTSGRPIKVDVKTYAADLIARAPKLDVFEVVGESFNLWTKNFWPLVGVALVTVLLIGISGIIPLGSLFLSGIFMGGLYYFYLGKLRGEHREFGDSFAGFSRSTVQLMLAGLVIILLTVAMCLPMYLCLVGGIFLAAAAGSGSHLAGSSIMLGLTSVGFLLIFPAVYFGLCWRYSYALIIDKNIGFWDAMGICRRVVSHQWWRVFAIALVTGIIAMLGIIGLFVGIFLTMPLVFAAETVVYDRLFNPPPRA